MTSDPDRITIHTDGSFLPDAGMGGWAALIRSNGSRRIISGGGASQDSHYPELLAVVRGLQSIEGTNKEIVIKCDVDGIEQAINRAAEAIAQGSARIPRPKTNPELWEDIIALMKRHRVRAMPVRSRDGSPDSTAVHWEARYAPLREICPYPLAVVTLKGRCEKRTKSGRWAAAIRVDGEDPLFLKGESVARNDYEMELRALVESLKYLCQRNTPFHIAVFGTHRELPNGIEALEKRADIPSEWEHRDLWRQIADLLKARPHKISISLQRSEYTAEVKNMARLNAGPAHLKRARPPTIKEFLNGQKGRG